jgi:hypothetical protein
MAGNIDLEELAQYLESDLSPDDCLGLSDLDGFLTGIVVGPELIVPSEWLPIVWGDEEPEFESTIDAASIIGLIMGRYNEIATGFNSDPVKFEPIFYRQPTGEVIVTDCGPELPLVTTILGRINRVVEGRSLGVVGGRRGRVGIIREPGNSAQQMKHQARDAHDDQINRNDVVE